MDKTKIELIGTKEVIEALDALDPKDLLSLVKAAERRALMTIVVKPLRTVIPYGPESKKAIGIVSSKMDRTALYAGVIATKRTTETTPSGKTVSVPPPGVIVRWLDLGTAIRTTKKGWNRGMLSPRGVIQPFILGQIDDIIEFFNKDFGGTINEIMEKRLKNLKNKQNK